MSFFEASYAYLQAAVAPIAPPILVAALVYAVVNRKVLPFAWHVRLFPAVFPLPLSLSQSISTNLNLPPPGPLALFLGPALSKTPPAT